MLRIRLFHWRESEAQPLIAQLCAAGYAVDYPGDSANGNFRSLREHRTHAVVIDLTRLPSHGLYVAAEIRANKAIRHIPIVFVDGEPAKVERIRGDIPDATFTTRAKLATVLKRVKPLADPHRPARMMASDRSTAQKLGITAKSRVALIDPPPGYAKILGPLPEGAFLEEDPADTFPLTLWFVRDPDLFQAGLPVMRRRAAQSRIWVIYPKAQAKKKTDGGLTQFFIRSSALDCGLVDYKICSVDATWTGLLFTVKK